MTRIFQSLTSPIRNTFNVLADNVVFFSQSTGLHGVKFIGNRSMKPWERIFFLSAFVVILTYVAVLISNLWDKWDRTPIIVAMSPQPIQIKNFPFPTITICNVNQLRRGRIKDLPRNSTEYSILRTMCSENIDDVDPKVQAQVRNRTFFQNYVLDAAQPCDRLLITCKYGNNDMKCMEVFRTVLTDEGICCTFNSLHRSFVYRHHVPFSGLIEKDGTTGVNWDLEEGYPKKLPMSFYPRTGTGTGVNLGLTVTINAEVDDYTCTTTNGPGFKVLLTNAMERPTLRENGLFVEVGAEVSFRISAERTESTENIRSFSIKDRQCVFKTERRLANFRAYTKSNCELECLANMTESLCGCSDFFIPDFWTTAPSCTVKDDPCQEPILNWADVSPMQKKCKDFCLKECFDLSYRPRKYSIPLSTDSYLIKDEFLNEYNATYRSKNIAVVHFYYESSDFIQFMRTRYIGPTEFTSNAGGLIGFLGFSFITVAEMSYFIILKSVLSFGRWMWWMVRGKPSKAAPQRNGGPAVRQVAKNQRQSKFGRISPIDGRLRAMKRIAYRP